MYHFYFSRKILIGKSAAYLVKNGSNNTLWLINKTKMIKIIIEIVYNIITYTYTPLNIIYENEVK